MCQRLPDCPHFHLVFTIPEQLHELFELNYRALADALTAAAADTLKQFQKNNWGMDGGFLSVLHTWGSALNWHPHLHVLVAAGGVDQTTGAWKRARSDYSFPVKNLSQVREVRFRWKDYRDGGRVKERTLPGKTFVWLFSRHLVPKGYRRIRYFGWLVGSATALDRLSGNGPGKVDEKATPKKPPPCGRCQGTEWSYLTFFSAIGRKAPDPNPPRERFSLVVPRAGP